MQYYSYQDFHEYILVESYSFGYCVIHLRIFIPGGVKIVDFDNSLFEFDIFEAYSYIVDINIVAGSLQHFIDNYFGSNIDYFD